jgi:[ribosomal protein S5]-alanine N-acetyltransferase
MIIAETERLLLRHFHVGDAAAMNCVFCDAEVMRFGRGAQTSEWVKEWLLGCLEKYHQTWGFGHWAVVEKASHETLGLCGLAQYPDIDGQTEIEIGYRLARPYWGKGYATEAAKAVRDYGFNTLGFDRLVSIIDPRNVASNGVAEKLGMQYEKDIMFKDYTHADRLYTMTRPGLE